MRLARACGAGEEVEAFTNCSRGRLIEKILERGQSISRSAEVIRVIFQEFLVGRLALRFYRGLGRPLGAVRLLLCFIQCAEASVNSLI